MFFKRGRDDAELLLTFVVLVGSESGAEKQQDKGAGLISPNTTYLAGWPK